MENRERWLIMPAKICSLKFPKGNLAPFLLDGELLELDLFVEWTEGPFPRGIEVDLIDYFGQHYELAPVFISKVERFKRVELNFPGRGIFEVQFRLMSEGAGVLDQKCIRTVVLPPPILPPPGEARFGINLHVEDVERNLEWIFQVCQKAGIGWIRFFHLIWEIVEPQRGRYNWEQADYFVKMSEKYNIQLLGVLGYAPFWATDCRPASRIPADLKQWAQHVSDIVNQYKSIIHFWEIWNEQDLSESFTGSVVEYARVLEEGYLAAKRADPQCKVLFGGIQGCQPSYMEEALKLDITDFFDIFNTHAYWGPDWESVGRILQMVKEQPDAFPCWLTEIGKAVPDEKFMARFMVFQVLEALKFGFDKIFWHTLSDADDLYAMVYLSREYPEPRAFYPVYANLARLTPGYCFFKKEEVGERSLATWLYSNLSKTRMLILWSNGRPEFIRFKADSPVRFCDIMGNEKLLEPESGEISVITELDPIFLEGNL